MHLILQNLNLVKSKVNKIIEIKQPKIKPKIIVVTKTFTLEKIKPLLENGHMHFGENKIQEAVSKIDEVNLLDINWHFIGHLQKNKIKYIDSRFELIHSVDSLSLAEKISAHCESHGEVQAVLLQVNISGEDAKFGMTPTELKNQLKDFGQMRGIRVHGLMMIPPQCDDPEDSRQFFCGLRELRDECLALKVQGIQLKELSMGMTNDYKIAVEEGATLVRVGTAIFGERNPD